MAKQDCESVVDTYSPLSFLLLLASLSAAALQLCLIHFCHTGMMLCIPKWERVCLQIFAHPQIASWILDERYLHSEGLKLLGQ